MLKIAIIQFPGLNTEYETRREINRCGMQAEFFRWNDDYKKLAKYDGYVIGGGFSYEDRGRAGVIASLDPIMEKIKIEAEKGKPVLGICNGAQILLECGLIPGVDNKKLVMALARNKRIRDGEILGTGYYNVWTNLKCVAKNKSNMFSWNINEGEILQAPVAHGEGRFTTDIPNLIQNLQQKGQMVFRYCNKNGVISEDFPVNPNGAMFNIAAICNPAGNVMSIMPHLERSPIASEKLFTSMRDALLARKAGGIAKKRIHHLMAKPVPVWPMAQFQPLEKNLQMFVTLIITDNEAETFEITLKNLGKVAPLTSRGEGGINCLASSRSAGLGLFDKISLKRTTHIELGYQKKPDLQKLTKQLIQSGVLLNTNKELATVKFPKETLEFDAKREKFMKKTGNFSQKNLETEKSYKLLVREKPDFVGMAKLATIQKRLKFNEISDVRTGTLWEINIGTKSEKVAQEQFKKLISTYIFFNPHRQEAFLI